MLYSGHPLGLFPSAADAPRVVVTNGMVVPNYSSGADYIRQAALGVTSYGQMTAGSYMYIGPQGIVSFVKSLLDWSTSRESTIRS